MKSQIVLGAIIKQMTAPLGVYSDKDVRTVNLRTAAEGRAFLEITLPQLDDLLLAGLSTGVLPDHSGWGSKTGTRLPKFLYGLWKMVFSSDGTLHPTPSIDAIRNIRQISRSFKKIFEVCSDENVLKAVHSFHETDRIVGNHVLLDSDVDALAHITHRLFGGLIGASISGPLAFKHGPGAVAEGYDSIERWDFPVVTQSADELVGIEQFRATWHDLLNRPPGHDVIPARLIAVPKTADKPRLITIEPSYNQFLQQGLLAPLKAGMMRLPVCNITDQERNKDLARIGSMTGSLATVDLSDASDRLSWQLVRRIFGWNSAFVDFLKKTRSIYVDTPTGLRVISKFAGMGSALTFPVQTMVYTAICALAYQRASGSRIDASFLHRPDFGVYGDDIIVPSYVYPFLVPLLESFGLKVNTNKSFSEGGFRESCGGDYFRGINVTPVYLRRRMPASKRDVSELVSLSSFRNNFTALYGDGQVSSLIDSHMKTIVPYPAVSVSPEQIAQGKTATVGSGLYRVDPFATREGQRWNTKLQRNEIRMMVVSAVKKESTASSSAKLFKTLYEGGWSRTERDGVSFRVPESDHITHHGRPVSFTLKTRWVAVP